MNKPTAPPPRPTKVPPAFAGPDGTRNAAIAAYEQRMAALDAEIADARALSREGQLVPAHKLVDVLTREKIATWKLLELAKTMEANDAVMTKAYSERQVGKTRVSLTPEQARKFAVSEGYYERPKRITKDELCEKAAKALGVSEGTFYRRLTAKPEKSN